jgi:short-subunit dehydrogenase
MERLNGRHAVLTGASRGVGMHLALALAKEGVNLTLAARSAGDLQTVRDQVVALGCDAIAVPTDVGDADQRAALLAQAEAALGPVDILVNNAGVEWSAFYADQDEAEIHQTMTINLTAPMLLTRAALPSMIKRGEGHILNLASAAGKSGTPYEAAYSASKFGLIGFSHALRAELSGTGVGCSVVCPGFIADDGMYARFADQGLKASPILGVSKMSKVTGAVIDAIKKDRADVVVNPTPLRPVVALETIVPGVHGWMMRTLGVTELFAKAAQMRGAPE